MNLSSAPVKMPEPDWALGGLYKFVFLHLEPVSTITPAIATFILPGSTWFYNQLVPGLTPAPDSGVDVRARMAVLQLANCYMLLGLISSFVFRAIRDSLPQNPIAQENIIKATLIALAIADVTHVLGTFVTLPSHVAYAPGTWNATTHGNITFTLFLFLTRVAWMLKIGRGKGTEHRKAD
ncbi:transmembrane protein, putative [Rhizoctonia solani AG-3 Rhs1AP]|uniref:Transmembrane protein, putative n=1 Tax=Rhizoctonia solani AG-3 Rhs1AP TaxID=1086054 RepID=X8IUK7_9AGAM|nr:transmembrane protein, putative [Rhizoctonia solani AG-3 Rhs1AP]